MISPEKLAALELARDRAPSPNEVRRVERQTSAEAAAWAFTQWELRKRAALKFTRASEMLFVREALEQATHERIAEYHASRFPSGELVADLTTGLGADLIALARRGPVLGFETDEERAEMARFNLEALGLVGEVLEKDSLSEVWRISFAFADPARRVEGRRTLDISEFSPDPLELSRRMSSLELGGIKLSPLLRDEVLESLGPRLEFISFGGECREALVWTGARAQPGRYAVHVESGTEMAASDPPGAVTEPGEFLFEADPAAIRAHCLGTLCGELGIVPLGDSNGYLTRSARVSSPWVKGYRVLHHGKADLTTTRRVLSGLGSGTPVLKQRGAGEDLDSLRRRLKLPGVRSLIVAIWPVGKSLKHTVLEAV